jgi:cadmium resistance protein CadD (predicted permease)
MAATPTQSWKPGKTVIRWAWASIITLAAGAWIGGIFVFIQQTIAITALVVSLPVFFFALARLLMGATLSIHCIVASWD